MSFWRALQPAAQEVKTEGALPNVGQLVYIPSHVLWGAGLEKQSLHMPECVRSPHVAGFRKQNRARKQTRTFMKACLHGVTSLVGVRRIEVKIDAQVSMGVRVTGQSHRYPLLPFC